MEEVVDSIVATHVTIHVLKVCGRKISKENMGIHCWFAANFLWNISNCNVDWIDLFPQNNVTSVSSVEMKMWIMVTPGVFFSTAFYG